MAMLQGSIRLVHENTPDRYVLRGYFSRESF